MPVDVLKAREGNLAQTPLPVLLDAIHRAGSSCALELSLRQLRKRILFEEGAPVGCESNLLHETLGKRLVELGKLTEVQYQTALAESVKTGQQMGELLVHQGLVTPYELYRQLQANLAQKILDCFRWSEASWRLSLDAEPAKSPLRMNPAKLIFTGVVGQLPFETVSAQLELAGTERFVAVSAPPATAQSLKLAGRDQRFLQVLRSAPTFAELLAKTQLEAEPALRRLYALLTLGLVQPAEGAVPSAPPGPAPVEVAPAPSAPEKPSGLPFRDEDPKARDELMAAFLEHRKRDPLTLLGVKADAPVVMLRQRFLELADAFSPTRFATPELKEKAEVLLVAHARAFALLADPEQRAQWERQRKAAEEKKQSAPRPSTAEQFAIRTDLLDADTQYAEGRKRLKEGNPRGALEYFEYACDIDPKPRHRAWRAWARYRTDPARHARLALQELSALMNEEGVTDEVFGLAAQIHMQTGNPGEAETCFRKAYKLNPSERAYAEGIQAAMKAPKR